MTSGSRSQAAGRRAGRRWLPSAVLWAALMAVAGCGERRPAHPADDAAARAPGAAASPFASASAPHKVVAVARGSIEVPGGLVEVGAPQDGIVETVAVQEGDRVKVGQVLLNLSGEAQRQASAMALAELRLARVRQEAQGDRLPAASDLARRTTEAARAGAVDAQAADDARRNLQELESGVAVARAETAVAERKLAQIGSLAGRLVVRASEDAIVVRRQVQPGAQVFAQGGKPLLTLLPSRPLQLRAELNEAYLSRVSVGMRASVYLDTDGTAARPELPAARVVRLGPMFLGSRLQDDSQPRGHARAVDCVLEFDQPPPLRVGQAVRVEFHD